MDVSNGSTKIADELARLLVSPRAYAEQTALYQGFAWLRSNNPVGRVEVDGYDPFWAVTNTAISSKSAARMTCSTMAMVQRCCGRGPRTTWFGRCGMEGQTSSGRWSTWMRRST
jgi:hypothetical protein